VVVKKKSSTAQSVGAGGACISCLPACSSYTINNIISQIFFKKINHIFHSAPGLAFFQTQKNKKGFFFPSEFLRQERELGDQELCTSFAMDLA